MDSFSFLFFSFLFFFLFWREDMPILSLPYLLFFHFISFCARLYRWQVERERAELHRMNAHFLPPEMAVLLEAQLPVYQITLLSTSAASSLGSRSGSRDRLLSQ